MSYLRRQVSSFEFILLDSRFRGNDRYAVRSTHDAGFDEPRTRPA